MKTSVCTMVSFPDHILCSLSENSLGMRLVTTLVGACEHSAVCKTLLSSTHSNMKQYIHVHLVLDFFFLFRRPSQHCKSLWQTTTSLLLVILPSTQGTTHRGKWRTLRWGDICCDICSDCHGGVAACFATGMVVWIGWLRTLCIIFVDKVQKSLEGVT